jgi:uncharacterized protein YyaL (SSP411 family)
MSLRSARPNRLAKETSPYLQRHAENPVDWSPGGEEALAEAKRTGKPILLSVGYSACHWCHVMAHESFEDAAIAKVMNDLFVNIKVDREERPDIDQIYQVAQAMITQRNGGWPLTMFLTPDQLPFFGGTYFPNVSRYGMPAFPELLKRVRQYYDENPEEVRGNGEHVVTALAGSVPKGGAHPSQFSALPLDHAAADLGESFDRKHGGFSGAPKFPHPDSIELLLRRHARTGDPRALEMAAFTLRKMAEGGIYDQVGGGFARYSVDAEWAIPHFEKMLYDNGWLMRLYADAWAVTREPLFARVCRETAEWLMREMQSPDGGYYSSLDADSEGHEGKYYVWSVDEVRAALSAEELAAATLHFGLDQPRNFENHAWHLVVARPIAEVARALGKAPAEIERLVESTRRKLYAEREKRVRPGRDEKILTSWNALMIAGMARAGRVFGRADWIDSARRALDFLRRVLVKDGRLLATCKDGRAHLDAYLDDHAYLLAALLEMLQADFRAADLEWAEELGAMLMDRFHDDSAGGFFFTSHGHESLIHRPKPGPDNATPSGNAVAALALNRLAFLTGETRYSDAAADTVALFWAQAQRQPTAFGTLLAALEEQLVPPGTVIVRGEAAAMAPWRALLDPAYLPTRLTLFVPAGAGPLPPPLDKPTGATVNAWVCEGVTCLPPIATPEELRKALDLRTIAPSHESPTPRSHP